MNTWGIKPCPPDGHGRHEWQYATAWQLRRRGYSVEATVVVLLAEMRRTGPENYDDVLRTVEKVYREKVCGSSLPRTTTTFALIEFPKNSKAYSQLISEAGHSVHVRPRSALDFIKVMLGDSPAVCIGDEPYRTTTVATSSLHEGLLRDATLLVPSPMSGVLGVNKEGKQSNRCESLVLERRYQIVEYDDMDFDDQAIRIQHLRKFGIPLVAVVFSGGESLHAWFDVRRLGTAEQADFFTYAVQATGADPAHRSPIQMTRMPLVNRPKTQAYQSLEFFQHPANAI